MREIAAENDRRRRWPDDDVAWTIDQWERLVTAIEQTRGVAMTQDRSELLGLGPVLFGTWRKVRGYLDAGLTADEIHRALHSDAVAHELREQRMAAAQQRLPLRSRVAAE